MQARLLLPFFAGCLCIGFGGPAAAAQGTVIWKNQECGFFILQTARGYTLLEWIAGAAPHDGDIIEGDIEAKGAQEFHNRTADLPVTAHIAARSSRRSEAEKGIPPRCH